VLSPDTALHGHIGVGGSSADKALIGTIYMSGGPESDDEDNNNYQGHDADDDDLCIGRSRIDMAEAAVDLLASSISGVSPIGEKLKGNKDSISSMVRRSHSILVLAAHICPRHYICAQITASLRAAILSFYYTLFKFISIGWAVSWLRLAWKLGSDRPMGGGKWIQLR